MNNNGIVSQVNINDIIAAAKNVEASNTVLTSAVKTIDTLLSKIKEPDKKLKDLQKIEILTGKYCDIVNSIIDTVVKEDGNNKKNLADLLGRITSPDPNDKNKNIEKWTVVDAAMQIPNIINSVFKVIDSVASFDGGRKRIRSIRKNLIAVKIGLNEIFNSVIEVFSNFKADKFSDVLNILVNEPDTITNIIENNTSNKSSQTSQFTSNVDQWDKSKTQTITKHGKMGLLDAIEKIFSVVGLLNNMKAPNLLNVKLQIFMISKGLKIALDTMKKEFGTLANPEYFDLLINLGVLLNGDEEKKIPGLNDIVTTLKMTINQLNKIKFNISTILILQLSLLTLKNVVNQIINFTSGDNYKFVANESFINNVEAFNNNIKKLFAVFDIMSENIDTMIKISLFKKQLKRSINAIIDIKNAIDNFVEHKNTENNFNLDDFENTLDRIISIQKKMTVSIQYLLTGWIAFIAIKRFINKLPKLIDAINSISEKINKQGGTKEIIEGIADIEKIISSIVSIQKNIIKASLLCIPAAICMIAIIGFVWTIVLFIQAINKLTNITKPNIIQETSNNIINITKIFVSLMIVSASIIATIAISMLAAKIISENLIPTVLVFVGAIGFLVLSFFAARLLSEIAEKLSIKTTLSILIICSSFIVAALAILVAGAVGKTLKEDGAIGNVLLGITGIIVISTIMVGLGLALSVAAPFMTIAIASLIPLVVTLGLILGAALAIVALSKIKFDFGTFTPGKDAANGKFGTGSGAAGVVGQTLEFVKYLRKRISDMGNSKEERKDMRKSKRMLKQVYKNVKFISDIAKTLEIIQKLEFNEKDITEKLNAVFGFVETLEDKIVTLINAKPKKEVVKSIESVDNANKNAKDMLMSFAKAKMFRFKARAHKRDVKVANKSLSKIESTINLISGMSSAIMSLKDFTITENDKKTINDNITHIMSILDYTSTTINNKNKTIKIKDAEEFSAIIEALASTIESASSLANADNKNLDKNISSYSKFIDKLNTIEVTKLNTASTMFSQMAKLSSDINKEFTELTNTLSEKMVPTLEELKNTIDKIPTELKVGFQQTSASIGATTAPITATNTEAQVRRENPGLSKDEVNRIVTTRMNERAKADANGISAKLDELLILLRGFNGEQIVVRTV